MSFEADFDDLLRRSLAEAALPESDFTERVLQRLRRQRRQRRRALGGAASVAAAISGSIGALAAGPWIVVPPVSAGTLVAAIVLAAACSVAWLAGEPGPLPAAPTRT
jgi:CHASE2 domain-containing sensor protein